MDEPTSVTPLQRKLVGELRAAYHESGLTYRQLACRSEMSTGTIERALTTGRVGVPALLRLCRVLQRSVVVK